MSLSPASINSMLASNVNVFKQTLPFTPAPKIIRKHYTSHEPYHDHHEHHEHHEEHHYGKKQSRSIALTALTLLAFLFFLHILQQCLHDQVEMSTTPAPTVVMQANIQAKQSAVILSKKAQDRVDESEEEDLKPTTPYGYHVEERTMVTEGVTEGSSLYDYEKYRIPIKMKVVQKNGDRLKHV
ncbi:unnamed protein product [Phyllotreta striolata]|uniref:Uncharacterized protein n=1 Tax=Phyllotreta striolata TaxID=444603 RepID=A0A9P0DW59_PHYSR|nr:unnamed protein product [Phyllotreta striolata]